MMNPNLKPILVAVDFSDRCRRSLQYAGQLAERLGRPLLILHVVHETAEQAGFYRSQDTSSSVLPLNYIAQQMLTRLLDDVACSHSSGEVFDAAEKLVVEGLPGRRILEVAELYDACTILLGSAGPKVEGGLSRLWSGAGAVASRVIRHSTVPVVTPAGEVVNQTISRPGNLQAPAAAR